MLGVEGRGGKNGAVILENGIAFRVAATGIVAFNVKGEFLTRIIGGDRARNNVGDGIFTV